MEESICRCYAETIELTSNRLVKMILVDASFILELFFRHSSESMTKDPLVGEPRGGAVMLDSIHSLLLRLTILTKES